jgi:glycerophosphoryl diester phosphodiesterase
LIADLRHQLGRPLVVGHRGAMTYVPENTIASFERGVQLGADVVELDLHLTSDGVPVVIHDDTLDRTTDGHGAVARTSLAEIRALDAGAWFAAEYAGARVPTLDEALEWSRSRQVPLAIELKGFPRPDPLLAERVVEALHRHAATERGVVISFDHPTLTRIRALAPQVRCGALYVGRPADGPALARAAGADMLLPQWRYLMAEDVVAAHAANLTVQPWESSDLQALRSLVAMGVDGVTSNSPDIARQAVESNAIT